MLHVQIVHRPGVRTAHVFLYASVCTRWPVHCHLQSRQYPGVAPSGSWTLLKLIYYIYSPCNASIVFFLAFIVQSRWHLSHFVEDAKSRFCCNHAMRVWVGLIQRVNLLNWLSSWLICSWCLFVGLIRVGHGERPSTNCCILPKLRKR